MCGIFAYKGSDPEAVSLVIEGLKKLEYRGYDSWGIAYLHDGTISVEKQVGKIGDFDGTGRKFPPSNFAMGHSRWATHGRVTQANAHPHLSASGKIAIVHNGIIENYAEIKERLMLSGAQFKSETDTEVVAHLIESHLDKGYVEAVKAALAELRGRYAFLVMNADDDRLIAARRGSPLIIGKGENGNYFVASDIPAFIKYTRDVMYLDDEQMAVLDGGHEFYDLKTGEKTEKRIVQIDMTEQSAEKGDYPHFMIKEIMEQKDTIYRAINQNEVELAHLADEIRHAFGTYFVGCGTAGKVCLAASYLFSRIAKRHVNVEFGSEFTNFHHFIKEKSLVVGVSQSGETADTLEALEVAKRKGAHVLSILNAPGSTMERISDFTLHINVGPEKAVASTKATTAQLAILTLLAYACDGRLEEGKKLLIETASQINDMLNPRYEEHIAGIAARLQNVESMYVIGRGVNYPMALEAAIKLQEVSYIHAEGFAGGELKHGPIALIEEGTPCLALIANDETREDMLTNIMEIKARGGYIIGVGPEKEAAFDEWIRVPDAGDASPIVNIIPVQILAYTLAVLRQNNPDMPRNLAKSVTVK